MKMPWGKLIHGPLPGSLNMAVDHFLFEEAEAGRLVDPVLRLYEWQGPVLSLGFHQRLPRAANVERCAEKGVELVRRPTGGRAVLHFRELTYAIVAPFHHPFKAKVKHNYDVVAPALAQFARKFGSSPIISQGGRGQRPLSSAPCFASLSQSEIEEQEKKIIGSAQKTGKKSFLQHGSMPLYDHAELLQYVTESPLDMRQYMATLQQLSGGQLPSHQTMLAWFFDAFETSLEISFQLYELDLNHSRIQELELRYRDLEKVEMS